MFCPSCGAEIPADERFAKLVVCNFCDSAIVWDEKAARVAGKMAVLAQTPGPLYVGATGRIGDHRFTVLGRVRYGYSKGYWDEWCLALDNDATVWISEDENNFVIEKCVQMEDAPIDFASVRPGTFIDIGDVAYHIDEKDIAECEGGEGQLPFPILAGEKVPFLEISSDGRFGTIEFDIDDLSMRLFTGERLDISTVKLDVSKEEAGIVTAVDTSAERRASGQNRERIVKRDDRSKSITCETCGAPLEIPEHTGQSLTCSFCSSEVDLSMSRVPCPNCSALVPLHGGSHAKTVICRQCDSQIDVTRPEPTLLGAILSGRKPATVFQLGHKCTFDEMEYRVVGIMRVITRDPWGVYPSDEFLLYSKVGGYRWLVHESGHFTISTEMNDRPMSIAPRTARPKQRFKWNGKSWTVFERDQYVIEWVEGELPWVAQVGDRTDYMDAISPPQLLTAEWTETEMEWFLAEYLPTGRVAEAFGLQESELPKPVSVGACQPYPGEPFRSQASMVMLLFAFVFGLLAGYAAISKGTHVANYQLAPSAYNEEYLTDPFEIKGSNSLCKVKFNAPVDNSWVYMDVAVIDDKEQALLDFSAQMSYYHGREGGENWSEGSQNDSAVFKLTKPGKYRLLLKGQAGTGDKASDTLSVGKTVTIAVSEGATLARYYCLVAIGCAIWGVVEVISRATFEKRRWGEDDDD